MNDKKEKEVRYFGDCDVLSCAKCVESKILANKYYNRLSNLSQKIYESAIGTEWQKVNGLIEKFDKINAEFIGTLRGRVKCGCIPSWMLSDYTNVWQKENMNKEYTKYTVAVALRVGTEKVWMSQRINTVNFPGKWQFPGGKLDEDENPIDGGLRELKEETNLEIDCKRVRYCGPITGDPTTKTCFVYYIDLNEAEIPVRTENKMTDWVLLTYDEALKKDLMPGLVETMGKLRTMK